MRRIFIIRHGNTFNAGAPVLRVGAGTDLPLVESGVQQAERLADWFAGQDLPIRQLLSGPLQRARQTAGAIGRAIGRDIAAMPDWLDEIDHGPDEGRPEAEVVARIGEDALAAWDGEGVAPPGWIVQRDARIAGWRAYFSAGGDGVDLLVTSNGAARFALLAAGIATASLKLRTGAFGELAVADDGMVKLADWDWRP